jgi:hypothetical protein
MRNATSRLLDAYIRFRDVPSSIADHGQHEAHRCHYAKVIDVSCASASASFNYPTATRLALLLIIESALL